MRTLTILAFDEIIAGTGSTWYTPDSYHAELGACDFLVVTAQTTGVSGTVPTVTCTFEQSADGRQWLANGASPEINGFSMANDAITWGAPANPLLRFVRVKITLGGTSPQCRLKLFINGRASVAESGGQSRGMLLPHQIEGQ